MRVMMISGNHVRGGINRNTEEVWIASEIALRRYNG